MLAPSASWTFGLIGFTVYGMLRMGFAITALCLMSTVAHASLQVMGYYYVGSARKGVLPKDLPANRLTHLFYAFLDVSADGKCIVIGESDGERARNGDLLKQFRDLKKRHPHLKTILSIGGASNSIFFSDAAVDEKARTKFATSCVDIMTTYSFDGVDIDWEKPVYGGNPLNHHRPADKENFNLLLATFKRLLPKGASLSAAVDRDLGHYDVAGAAKYLDWFGVMTYDFCNRTAFTCHHSGFKSSGASLPSGEEIVQSYLKAGARPGQVVLGVPFYGYIWSIHSTDKNGLNQSKNQATPISRQIPYSELQRQYLGQAGFESKWDADAQEPFALSTQQKKVVSFDDARSLSYKRQQAEKLGLKGLMVWELSQDSQDQCLLKAVSGDLR